VEGSGHGLASICLEELRNTTAHIYTDNLCIGEHSNGGPYGVSQLAQGLRALASVHFHMVGQVGRLKAIFANINQKYQYIILGNPDGRGEAGRP
jgi:hypothetical protein